MQPPRNIPAAQVFSESDFPLSVRRIDNHGDTTVHGHAFHELVLILGGTGQHVTAHGRYPLKTGDVFLIRGSTTHGYANVRDLRLVNILFAPRRLRLPLRELDVGTIPGYHALFRIEPRMRNDGRTGMRLGLSTGQLEGACGIIEALEDELHARRPGCRFMACSHLMRLIGYLSRCYSASRSPRTAPVLGISRALSHIEEHYADPVSIAELARAARMSESSLMRHFRNTVGHTPIDYLIRTRVHRACELLRQEEGAKITAIAMRCGFGDGNYFSRQFRLVMGCTPRAYRVAVRI